MLGFYPLGSAPLGSDGQKIADGDEAVDEFAVLKYMFNESFDWAKSKPATFLMDEIKNGLGNSSRSEAAIHALAKKKLILRDTSKSSNGIGYRIARAGVNYLAAAALGADNAPAIGSTPVPFDSTKWTGTQFVLVDCNVIEQVREAARSLHVAVYSLQIKSNAESNDLKRLADALVAICEMTEPEVRLIDRIVSSPKFKRYAQLIGLVAGVRGALGI